MSEYLSKKEMAVCKGTHVGKTVTVRYQTYWFTKGTVKEGYRRVKRVLRQDDKGVYVAIKGNKVYVEPSCGFYRAICFSLPA